MSFPARGAMATTEQAETAAAQAQEAYQLALADGRLAQLNLDGTQVKAPVNGRIMNLELRPGNYVSPSTPLAALVDKRLLLCGRVF